MGAPSAAVSAAQQVRQREQQRRADKRNARQLGQQQAAERRQREQAALRQPGNQPAPSQATRQQAASPGRNLSRPARAQRAVRTPAGPRTGRKLQIAGKAGGGVLLAEYLIGVLLISSSIFTKGPTKGYLDTMSQILLRLTALTAVFFVLFLAAGSAKAGKAAAWFGLLVDLGILFTAVNESQVATLVSVVKGDPTGVDQVTLDKAIKIPEPAHDQLPS